MHKKSLFILFFLFGIHLCQLFFLHYDGKIKARSYSHGFSPIYTQTVAGLDSSMLDEIFKQPFRRLGMGKQMIALISEDQKYVLKLFNPMRPLQKKWYTKWKCWKEYSSLKWLKREWLGRTGRLKKLFKRHKIAYEMLKEETGLLFVHLAPSKQVSHYITVIDDRGKEIQLHLADTPFVLQKKATLVPAYLNNLIQTNRIEEAKAAIVQIEKLLEKRLEARITDRIQTMENNYGFVDGKPIQIDVGRIRFNEPFDVSEEKERIFNNFQTWTAEHYGHLLH